MRLIARRATQRTLLAIMLTTVVSQVNHGLAKSIVPGQLMPELSYCSNQLRFTVPCQCS